MHFPTLDGLRGIAIFLVVAHMLGLLTTPSTAVGGIVSDFFTFGWVGVQLFFVLSGFLITGILLDTQRAPNYYAAFFARRGLRVFPLYYATLFVGLILVPAFVTPPPNLEHDRQHQIWLGTYLSNWTSPYDAGAKAFTHCWSLAVEEQFYLVWPFVVRRLTPTRCLQVCIVLAIVALGVRIAMLANGAPHGAIYTFSVTRMDALALGAAAAASLRMPSLASYVLSRRRMLWVAAAVIGLAGARLTHLYSLEHSAGITAGYSFLSVAFALAVLAAACGDSAKDRGWVRLLRTRPLQSLGKYSYAVYLFHKPLHDFVGRRVIARFHVDPTRSTPVALAYVACGLIVAFAAAVASYWLFERRFLALKDRFVPRVVPAQPVARTRKP
ncbi:MAG: Peptidoglycan/LPS O-acetylase OafA/YrhL, contains acyltransferase and SGNH-hydrolase domain [Labilithrix sp.]|nr:Peptidoglycan/LPS O-acetylase OafA/YrhL, contains acyltransferase and SGNH-hydrolase domain [Labilithrix sp.]